MAPDLLLDVAHNPAGAWTLRAAIAQLPEDRPRTLIFSCLRDKSLTEMAQILFPLFDAVGGWRTAARSYCAGADCESTGGFGGGAGGGGAALGVPAAAAADLAGALALARRVTPEGGLIVATGSVYLVGEIRQLAVGQ